MPVLATALARESMDLALVVFLAGMATDVLDGHIARTRGPITDFGKLMDPIADKLFVGTAFVSLAALGMLEVAIVAIILTREVAVSGLRWVAKGRGVVISADAFGKAKTGLQVLTVSTLIYVADPDARGCRASRRAHDCRHNHVRHVVLHLLRDGIRPGRTGLLTRLSRRP